jgi:hypothetical protein
VTDLAACDAAAAINGIDVRSRDRHVETSSWTVLAGGGYLTNGQSWNLVRPIYGRAVGANNVTFSSESRGLVIFSPSLSKLPPGTDAIDILIEYGDCSPALQSTGRKTHKDTDNFLCSAAGEGDHKHPK